MFNRKFPYSDIDVVVVEKEDILKTIDDNIIDKEIALELISNLEVKAEAFIKDKKWTAIPYLGNIRMPKGLSDEVQESYKDAREYAYATMNKKSYIAFVREIALNNAERIKYNGFFNQVLAMAVRKDKNKFARLCRSKGENWASCKMVFGYLLKPMKENYEYVIESNEEIEDGEY